MSGFRLTEPRLLTVAEMVRQGAVAADIGTDHGYLACHLVSAGVCPSAYACDVAPRPLARAAEHIKALGLRDKISVCLTDGLKDLPLGHITDIVIAGMGGELIARIIGECPAARDPALRFILQPMTKAERLRSALSRMGFGILSERAVAAGGFLYPVITAAYDGGAREADELFTWIGNLPDSAHPDSAALLDKIRQRLLSAARGLLKSGRENERAGRYTALAEEIGKISGESHRRLETASAPHTNRRRIMKQYFVQDYYNVIEAAAPFDIHEPGDNVGLLIGSGEQPVNRALLALDATLDVIAEASALDARLIVTHHPVIRDGLKSLPCDSAVYKAAQAGIAVISAHTNLDIADAGVNDVLAARLELSGTRVLEPLSNDEKVGIGRVGDTAHSFDPRDFAAFVCEKLGIRAVKFVAGKEPVTRAAVCGGTGGSLLSRAKNAGAQALVTADCKHSQLLEAARLGITLIDAGHYATEALVLPALLEKLRAALPDADIRLAAACKEPAEIIIRDI